jgi:hypothetical protein
MHRLTHPKKIYHVLPYIISSGIGTLPGKVKQDKDFFQESKHKERSIASFNKIITIFWQYVNLLSRFFHSQQSVINIDEVIYFLEPKTVWLQAIVTEDVLA